MRFLEQFKDDGLPHDPSWTPDGERSRQLDRLVHPAAVAMLCAEWSGRLAENQYTRQQRSMDKKISRRVTARLTQAIITWGGDAGMVAEYQQLHVDEIRKEAAILDWSKWWADHKVHVTACLRHVATQAVKNGYIKDGNSFCNALSNEYRSLDDVLGNLPEQS